MGESTQGIDRRLQATRAKPVIIDEPLKHSQAEPRSRSRRNLLKFAVVGGIATGMAASTQIHKVAQVLSNIEPVIGENQPEKAARFPAKRLSVGRVTFKVSRSMNLHTEPNNDPEGANVVGQVLKMGGKEVHEGDTIEAINPFIVDMETKSGVKTSWIQIPNVERRNLGFRNLIMAYAPLNNGNKFEGSIYETTGIEDGLYQLKGHEPVPVDQVQIFKVNGN